MNNIRIRYTWKRKSDGDIKQSVYSIQQIEAARKFGAQPFEGLYEGYDLIARDLWVGVRDREGNDIFNNDTFEVVVESGEVMQGVVQYGSHRREMKSGKTVDINGYAFVVRSFPTFPIAKNYLGKHDLEIIKVTGNIHTNPLT